MDTGVMICGAAGQGVQTVGSILARIALKSGLCAFSWQDNESRIRGGSNGYSIRICDAIHNAPLEAFDALLPLDGKSRSKYLPLLKQDGVCVGCEGAGIRGMAADFASISVQKAGSPVFSNAVALGALAAILGFDQESVLASVREEFSGKTPEIIGKNADLALEGFRLAVDTHRNLCRPGVVKQGIRRYLISGSDACAMGAWAAGCRFMAAYPMSPSTGVITALSKAGIECRVFTEQAEDEIAAVNMAIGASFAGVRSMTATSGGGFALMCEAMSLAGMTEIPLVVVLAQRPGPATGLPTRTEQGDLLFAVHSGHGEFSKAVLAPSDAGGLFHAMGRAFDLAEKYQTPVVVLTDQLLMDSMFTLESFDTGRLRNQSHIGDGSVTQDYRRYRFTESGISPMIRPGSGSNLVCCDSDEHDEAGHITEDLEMRVRMVEKRLRKSKALQKEIAPPELYRISDAEIALVCWGSSRNAAAEAADEMRRLGRKAGMIHFAEVWPLPEFDFPVVSSLVFVEGNATGQMEGQVRARYGVTFSGSIRKFDGSPLDAGFILKRLAQ
jgi:2-oxoglutarate/2-oxoacid ferredoxin oxidoreductase subunit alpha